ncbi:hypothetical protein CGMCC3_g2487 [Colletotrichum fructicola]|nr:uncharacterized protein CGMCC3_g2487 [Colletotrichum fructicola]KAE9581380.1 hypothetical protein CGMCC3_g2487 [Colletotrichum fructicola]
MRLSIIAVSFSVFFGNAFALHRCTCTFQGSSCLGFSQVEDNQSCSDFCKSNFKDGKTC